MQLSHIHHTDSCTVTQSAFPASATLNSTIEPTVPKIQMIMIASAKTFPFPEKHFHLQFVHLKSNLLLRAGTECFCQYEWWVNFMDNQKENGFVFVLSSVFTLPDPRRNPQSFSDFSERTVWDKNRLFFMSNYFLTGQKEDRPSIYYKYCRCGVYLENS